jgi:hypothetical protein
MKAIETVYAGHRFRSRLEARWAVFFDHAGLEWQYEPQGYEVGAERRRYLPDFYLPQTETWVEVKPTDSMLDWSLLQACADPERGLPGMADSFRSSRGLLLLGPVPRHEFIDLGANVLHPAIQSDAGLPAVNFLRFGKSGPMSTDMMIRTSGVSALADGARPEGFLVGRILSIVSADPASNLMWHISPEAVVEAYTAARQARFEHGESGAP